MSDFVNVLVALTRQVELKVDTVLDGMPPRDLKRRSSPLGRLYIVGLTQKKGAVARSTEYVPRSLSFQRFLESS